MQTFLPYQCFVSSLNCLDNKRLGKQRVEALQILNALNSNSMSGWRNHPAVKMWKGCEAALETYKNSAITIWISRGFVNTMEITWIYGKPNEQLVRPAWLTEEFCKAHRSNLLRKNYNWYKQFGWDVPLDLPYIWPVGG